MEKKLEILLGDFFSESSEDGTWLRVTNIIYVDENKYQLWVDGYYLESFGNDLTALSDLTVISQ